MVRIGPFHKYSVAASASLLLLTSTLRAEPLPPVVERYEQMLVRSPGKGTAFDRVYQHFFEGEGVEQLSQRWKAKAGEGGPLAGNYWLLGGLLAERQGRADEALQCYQRVVELKPDEYRAWMALGDLQVSAGKFAEAIKAFDKALTTGAPPDLRPKLYTQLARSYQRNFNVEGAVRTWEKFVAEAPNDPFVLEEAGEALAEADRYTDAKTIFEKLRDLAGTDAYQRVRAILKLAHLEEQQGRTAKAQEMYESALPMAAESSWIHREVRGRIEDLFRRRDDLPGLVAYYEKTLTTRPKDVEAALRLSDALVELNKKKESVEWLRKAAEWAPDRKEVQLALAKRLTETGAPKDAVTILTKLSQSAGDDATYAEQIGEAYWQAFEAKKDEKDKAAAIEAWRKLAPETVKDPVKVSRLADLLRARGLADLAVAEYRRALALGPSLNDIRERLADYLFDLEREEEAWKEVEGIATGEQPDFLRLARLQQRHKRADLALESVHRGLEREPKSFDLLAFEWQLRSEAKQWDEALALFDPLSESAPNAYFIDDIEQRYLLALSAAGKSDAFKTESSEQLSKGTLTERSLRLLARQALASNDLELMRKALDEGKARFTDSFGLNRLEVEYARRNGSTDGRVRALQRLIELQPKQKLDWLREIVSAFREEERWSEALAVVQEMIAASPASAEVHVLSADLSLAAGRFEEGASKLRDAIKLSEQPMALYQRLSRIYLDRGDTSRARAMLDEAFEAAEKPADRLALMPQLTEAYFANNKIDELIARFRQRQSGEDDGWRYALYLAEIYKQTLDYGAARRELGRALAARPKDSALLRQMVWLASEEQNKGDELRYQAMLAEAEPSDANQYALIETLLENNQGAEAMKLIQRHFEALKKMTGVWDRLLPLLKQNDQLGALNEFLGTLPGAGKGVETQVQLATIQVSQGNLEAAKKIFWSIFDTKSTAAPIAAPAPAPNVNGYVMTPLDQRLSMTWQTRNAVQQMLDGSRYSSMRFYGSSLPSKSQVDPLDAARDVALLYLAGIAVKEEKITEFLSELDRHLETRGSTRTDRLISFSLVQAREPILQIVREQVRNPDPEAGADLLCFGQLMQLVQSNRWEGENLAFDKAEIEALYKTLSERVKKANTLPANVWYDPDLNFYAALGEKEKAKAVRQKLLSTLDLTKPENLTRALMLAVAEADIAKIKELGASISAAAEKAPSASFLQQLQWMPMSVMQNADQGGADLSPEVRMQVLTELLAIWYPANTPRQSLGSSQGNRYGNYGDDTPLPPTRYLDGQRINVIANIAINFGQMPNYTPTGGPKPGFDVLRRLLEEQSKTFPDARRIYPQLVLIYLDSWAGKHDEAIKRAQQLLAAQPEDDDLRLLTGSLLGKAKKHAEALAILKQIGPRYGAANTDLQRQLLLLAKVAGDVETGRKAALRLASMRLNSEERKALAEDLRQFGLSERAEQIAKSTSNSSSRSGNSTYENYQQLRKLMDEKKADESIALARQILSGDPITLAENEYTVDQAIGAFQKFGKLPELIQEYETAVKETPDSLRINYLLAAANRVWEAPQGRTISGPQVKLPCWLKLVRTGTKVTGFYSPDGTNWSEVGSMTLNLPQEVQSGLVLVGREQKLTTTAELGEVSITSGNTASGTGAAGSQDGSAPSPWVIKDLGRLNSPGKTEVTNHTFKMQAGAGWIGFDADALHFVHQPVTGDATVVAKVLATGQGNGFGEAGIMMRANNDPKAQSAAMVIVPGQAARFKYRFADGSTEKYWRKVMELRPDNPKLQRGFARWLQQAGKTDEALAVYDKMFASTPEALMENAYQLVEVYKKAKRLDVLAEKALAWKAPQNSNREWSYEFSRVADALADEKRWELAEKVSRKGIEIATYGDTESLNRTLIQALKNQDKKEEAFTVLTDFFAPPKDQNQSSSRSRLGFQSNRYVDSRPKWTRSLSIDGDGWINVPGVSMLTWADSEGLLPELGERIRALYDEKSAKDPDVKALLTLVKLQSGNPEALDELRELAKTPVKSTNNENVVILQAARELRGWPDEERLALEIYRSLKPYFETSSFLRLAIPRHLIETARLEHRLGDPAEAETLRALVATLQEDLGTQSNQNNRREFNLTTAERCLVLLLRAGMEKEYTDFLKVLKNSSHASKLGWTYDEERKMFAGEIKKPQAMVWLADPIQGDVPDAADIRFEIRNEHPYDHDAIYRFLSSRGRSIQAMEKERTLKFFYGRTREDLQLIGEMNSTKANGSWSSALPMGPGWLRAVIVEKNAKGETEEISSPMVPVMRSPNLIQNPAFTGVTERTPRREFNITGWSKLPAGVWNLAKGGPMDSGVVQFEMLGRERDQVLSGERIPLEKGKAYFQSAWLRPAADGTADIGRRYLDANGKEIKTTYFPNYTSFNWRWHGQKLTFGKEKDAETIPANAAFLEPVVKLRVGAEWTGLYLGAAPENTSEAVASAK